MLDILHYTFFQNAIFAILIISIACAIIGTYVIARRLVFITGGITHASFGGLGLGFFLGISPTITALVFAILSAFGVEWMSKRNKVREDSAIAVFWALGMAVGIIFIFLTPGYSPGLTEFLFGNILTITHWDLFLFSSYTILLSLFFLVFYTHIIYTAFDRDFAYTRQLPVRFIEYTMILLISICVVLTIRLVGIMLLMSLITIPQLTANLFNHRFKGIIWLSIVFGLIGGIGGLMVSYVLNVPAGACIVFILIIMYILARIYKHIFRKKRLKV